MLVVFGSLNLPGGYTHKAPIDPSGFNGPCFTHAPSTVNISRITQQKSVSKAKNPLFWPWKCNIRAQTRVKISRVGYGAEKRGSSYRIASALFLTTCWP